MAVFGMRDFESDVKLKDGVESFISNLGQEVASRSLSKFSNSPILLFLSLMLLNSSCFTTHKILMSS